MCARRWSSPPSAASARRAGSPVHTTVALIRAVARELTWGLPGAAREIAYWRERAAAIPDPALREDALEAIDRKRANIDGAVVFTTLAQRRSADLLRLLVAFEILADFLDCTSERGAHIGVHNGRQLHRALIEALDPGVPISEYFRYHPWSEDGGLVLSLVQTCREACARLPAFAVVQSFLRHAAELTQVLALNHEPNADHRRTLLHAWAATQFPDTDDLAWFELTGGASAWLTILALLALATDTAADAREARATFTAYLPWISLAGTLLDSYGDQDADASGDAHSYIAYYTSRNTATRRIGEVIRQSLVEASALPHGARHRVLVSSMVAMYLSKDTVRGPARTADTRSVLRCAGILTRLLVPVLRAWRILNNQQAT